METEFGLLEPATALFPSTDSFGDRNSRGRDVVITVVDIQHADSARSLSW